MAIYKNIDGTAELFGDIGGGGGGSQSVETLDIQTHFARNSALVTLWEYSYAYGGTAYVCGKITQIRAYISVPRNGATWGAIGAITYQGYLLEQNMVNNEYHKGLIPLIASNIDVLVIDKDGEKRSDFGCEMVKNVSAGITNGCISLTSYGEKLIKLKGDSYIQFDGIFINSVE